MKHVISIESDGTATCLWTEEINLAEIGSLDVRRASNVEFNPESQMWEVRLADNPEHVAFTAPSRAACIAWEVETLNARLAA